MLLSDESIPIDYIDRGCNDGVLVYFAVACVITCPRVCPTIVWVITRLLTEVFGGAFQCGNSVHVVRLDEGCCRVGMFHMCDQECTVAQDNFGIDHGGRSIWNNRKYKILNREHGFPPYMG